MRVVVTLTILWVQSRVTMLLVELVDRLKRLAAVNSVMQLVVKQNSIVNDNARAERKETDPRSKAAREQPEKQAMPQP